jgi:hypothetical protein
MGTGTASADPSRLEAAAQAVPVELKNLLATGPAGLSGAIAQFNAGGQSPPRVTVGEDELAGALSQVVAQGDGLDSFLVQVAAAFRAAGSGFVGPVAPGSPNVFTMDDALLSTQMAGWACPPPLEFRVGADGTYEILGPDGYWYSMETVPPVGATPLGSTQQVIDLGNPAYGLTLLAAGTIGFTGGSTQPNARPAPPGAYEYVHFDANGNLVVGPDVGATSGPRSPILGGVDAPQTPQDAAWGGVELFQNGVAEMSKYVDARYQNVLSTNTTFYVDPATGQRVAVVDAASIRYDNSTNEAIITSGRLTTDEQGNPTIVATPVDYDAPDCTGAEERPTEIHIPVEEN